LPDNECTLKTLERPSGIGPRIFRLLASLLIAVTVFGCKEEIVPEPYVPSSADNALDDAIAVATPFRETFFIDRAAAFAVGYRFQVARGQRMEARLETNEADSFRMFMDLFRMPEETTSEPVHVASGDEDELRLEFEPRRDGEYVLRLQAELLRGGSCSVVIRNVAALEFPVEGRDTGSIGSGFGASRDAGRRRHHGVDIFAPRHTPVLATSRAFVRRVTDWKRGGRVVWLHDRARSLHIYYAHLETQEVRESTWVEPGDVIGTVGNSGNARTTAPHLHFGIYVREEGPLDPYPFIHQPKQTPEEVSVELGILGSWARTILDGISLRSVPDRRAPPLTELDRHTPLRVWAGTGGFYRVALPDGSSGYVTARGVGSLDEPLKHEPIATVQCILDQPSGKASVMERIEPGAKVRVLGRYGEYLYVETPSGRTGWLSID
jgi:murein DD-endopeptidase MepM/ murein hydrolase activator NlpD